MEGFLTIGSFSIFHYVSCSSMLLSEIVLCLRCVIDVGIGSL